MTEKLQELSDAEGIIETLGGEYAVAKMLGVTDKAVNNWKNWNELPKRFYAKMLWELNQVGCTAAPERWGQMACKGLQLRRVCK